MKKWSQPKMEKLDVVSTLYGDVVKVTPDDSVKIGANTYYSFS